jgi:hypothetical protein
VGGTLQIVAGGAILRPSDPDADALAFQQCNQDLTLGDLSPADERDV